MNSSFKGTNTCRPSMALAHCTTVGNRFLTIQQKRRSGSFLHSSRLFPCGGTISMFKALVSTEPFHFLEAATSRWILKSWSRCRWTGEASRRLICGGILAFQCCLEFRWQSCSLPYECSQDRMDFAKQLPHRRRSGSSVSSLVSSIGPSSWLAFWMEHLEDLWLNTRQTRPNQ